MYQHETQPITSRLAIMSVAHMPFSNIIATSTNIVLHFICSSLPCGKKSNNSSPFWMFLHTLFSSKPLLHFTLTSQWTCHLECMTHNLRDSKNDHFACCINFKFRKKPFLVYKVFNGSYVNHMFKNKRNSKMSILKSWTLLNVDWTQGYMIICVNGHTWI